MDAAHIPSHQLEVGLELAAPAAGIAPLRFAATPAGHGYAVQRIPLPVGGAWRFRVDALVSELKRVSGEAEVTLP